MSSHSGLIDISPRPACTKMFRAISEMAVAIKVASVREKPRSSANLLLLARASTMSWSDWMETTTSSPILWGPLSPLIEKRECLIDVQSRADRVQI